MVGAWIAANITMQFAGIDIFMRLPTFLRNFQLFPQLDTKNILRWHYYLRK